MNNLPMNKKNNLFYKIKMFFVRFFNRKPVIKENDYQQSKVERRNENQNFKEDIKVTGIKNDALIKIEMQNQRNQFLKKIAENPELLNDLSMEELIEIENMYDEELKKTNKE